MTLNKHSQKIHFKTESEYTMKSIRFLLLTITTMFIIIAGLMVVLGISVYTHYHNFSFFYEAAKSGRFVTPSLLCVLFGMGLFIVTLFGFFGSLKQSTCLVNMYAFFLIIMVILKIVVVILSFTISTNQLRSYVRVPVEQYVEDSEISVELDALQKSLNCCGSTSYKDYAGMNFTSYHDTVVISTDTDTIVVPTSCCAKSGDVYCTRIRSTGCQNALVNMLVQNSSVIGILGVSVTFIQILGIIFALLLAKCIRKMKSEKALIQWKIREQMILAQKSEAEDNTVYIGHTESSHA
ncbi:CD63 antigen-like [Pieris napi]|uniref:CD63 antigen-like n=1 Tax=Pieris napi TaxID=78633 RepID=UPI001FB9F15D|nr:CD63 antigen-like [Pieris napi]